MAADITVLQTILDKVTKVDFPALQTSFEAALDKKDAAALALTEQVGTLQAQHVADSTTIADKDALIKQLQDQIAAGGSAVDLQPQVDQLTSLDSDILLEKTASDNA